MMPNDRSDLALAAWYAMPRASDTLNQKVED